MRKLNSLLMKKTDWLQKQRKKLKKRIAAEKGKEKKRGRSKKNS